MCKAKLWIGVNSLEESSPAYRIQDTVSLTGNMPGLLAGDAHINIHWNQWGCYLAIQCIHRKRCCTTCYKLHAQYRIENSFN